MAEIIHTLEDSDWQTTFPAEAQEKATQQLEEGSVLFFPNLAFDLTPNETPLLIGTEIEAKCKNISFNPNTQKIKGTIAKEEQLQHMMTMMSRYAIFATRLLNSLLPYYQKHLTLGRTSFRPIEIIGRKTSPRQDDTRLHVDAFPSSPNQGNRILRVFTNINPEERNRVWNLGQPFEAVLQHFAPQLTQPVFGYRKMLAMLGVTKSYRTLYDHYMLKLHDSMKLDEEYQQGVDKIEFHFPPGSTWVVMTDIVSHAALAGQFMLEQTFYLAPKAMKNPELSPLRVLERHFNQSLTI